MAPSSPPKPPPLASPKRSTETPRLRPDWDAFLYPTTTIYPVLRIDSASAVSTSEEESWTKVSTAVESTEPKRRNDDRNLTKTRDSPRLRAASAQPPQTRLPHDRHKTRSSSESTHTNSESESGWEETLRNMESIRVSTELLRGPSRREVEEFKEGWVDCAFQPEALGRSVAGASFRRDRTGELDETCYATRAYKHKSDPESPRVAKTLQTKELASARILTTPEMPIPSPTKKDSKCTGSNRIDSRSATAIRTKPESASSTRMDLTSATATRSSAKTASKTDFIRSLDVATPRSARPSLIEPGDPGSIPEKGVTCSHSRSPDRDLCILAATTPLSESAIRSSNAAKSEGTLRAEAAEAKLKELMDTREHRGRVGGKSDGLLRVEAAEALLAQAMAASTALTTSSKTSTSKSAGVLRAEAAEAKLQEFMATGTEICARGHEKSLNELRADFAEAKFAYEMALRKAKASAAAPAEDGSAVDEAKRCRSTKSNAVKENPDKAQTALMYERMRADVAKNVGTPTVDSDSAERETAFVHERTRPREAKTVVRAASGRVIGAKTVVKSDLQGKRKIGSKAVQPTKVTSAGKAGVLKKNVVIGKRGGKRVRFET